MQTEIRLPPFLCAESYSCSVFAGKNIKIELSHCIQDGLYKRLSDMAKRKKSLLSLGSTLGNREKNLADAVLKIEQAPDIFSVRVSQYRRSKPVGGPTGQGFFLNIAVEISTTLSAPELLATMKEIEAELGRERHARWDARTIDIDILTLDRLGVSSPELVLPHPRMSLRRFVLEPVCELAGDQTHPETGWSYQRHLSHLQQAGNYALTINLTDVMPRDSLADLRDNSSVFVSPSLPIAQTEEQLASNFDVLKQWGADEQFVLCNFAPRECLFQHPELIDAIERHERTVLTPRLLVILTDNIHNELRHQWVTKMMPNGIVMPWVFLDNFEKDLLTQELSALATCHL